MPGRQETASTCVWVEERKEHIMNTFWKLYQSGKKLFRHKIYGLMAGTILHAWLILVHLLPTTVPRGALHCHAYLVDGKMDICEGWVSCPRQWVAELRSETRHCVPLTTIPHCLSSSDTADTCGSPGEAANIKCHSFPKKGLFAPSLFQIEANAWDLV